MEEALRDNFVAIFVPTAVLMSSGVIIYCLKRRRDSKLGVCRSVRDMTGMVCIVTGTNSGLGWLLNN